MIIWIIEIKALSKLKTETTLDAGKRAEDGLDKIKEDMKEAEKNLNKLAFGKNNALAEPSKVFGKVFLEKRFFKNYSDKKRSDEKNEKTGVQKNDLGRMKGIAGDEREDEMDRNLDQVFRRPFITSI